MNKIVGSQFLGLETSYHITSLLYSMYLSPHLHGLLEVNETDLCKGTLWGVSSELMYVKTGAEVFIVCVVLSVLCGHSRDGITPLPF